MSRSQTKWSMTKWTRAEEQCLVEYIVSKGFVNQWPTKKTTRVSFWESVSDHLFGLGYPSRTSGSCRSKVFLEIALMFDSPTYALTHMTSDNVASVDTAEFPISSSRALDSISSSTAECQVSEGLPGLLTQLLTLTPPPADHSSSFSPISIEHSTLSPGVLASPASISRSDPLFTAIKSLSKENQVSLLNDFFCHVTNDVYNVSIPNDFVNLLLKALVNLDGQEKSNLVYWLCKGLGIMRPDGSDSLIPTSRMPFGLLQYTLEFFTKDRSQLKCPDDYAQWLETMYSLFGSKWSKLHCGPMYCVESVEQGQADVSAGFNRLEARVNVPGLGERSIRKSIAKSGFLKCSGLQVKVLDEAQRLLPSANWWIKADGVDLISGLEESTKLEWNGDVDLGDGHLQELYEEYCERLKVITDLDLALGSITNVLECIPVLQHMIQDVSLYLDFINNSLITANREYSKIVSSGSGSEKRLRKLGWRVDELSRLNTIGRKIKIDIQCWLDAPSTSTLHKVHCICNSLTDFIKGLYRHKRTAATHVFAIMISPDDRKRKPYALPVQNIPYASLNERQVRLIISDVILAMKSRRMNVVGFVANGEYNSMRSQGYSRPLSILRLKAQARAKYSQMGKTRMLKMLSPIRTSDGTLIAEETNPAVSSEILAEIHQLLKQMISIEDIVSRLRSRTVPSGYSFHAWTTLSDIEEESFSDKLRSILAQMEFTYVVRSWDEQGVPFRTYLYVPEIHSVSGNVFHEREDEGHVYKRIAQSMRRGGPDSLKLERFTEAMYDESSSLTYTALTGRRKQSIRDVDNLFSVSVSEFMTKRGYKFEAKFIDVIRNWRRACDERGLSQLQRCRFNYEFLNMILNLF